jgi:hypothetical protein
MLCVPILSTPNDQASVSICQSVFNELGMVQLSHLIVAVYQQQHIIRTHQKTDKAAEMSIKMKKTKFSAFLTKKVALCDNIIVHCMCEQTLTGHAQRSVLQRRRDRRLTEKS